MKLWFICFSFCENFAHEVVEPFTVLARRHAADCLLVLSYWFVHVLHLLLGVVFREDVDNANEVDMLVVWTHKPSIKTLVEMLIPEWSYAAHVTFPHTQSANWSFIAVWSCNLIGFKWFGKDLGVLRPVCNSNQHRVGDDVVASEEITVLFCNIQD